MTELLIRLTKGHLFYFWDTLPSALSPLGLDGLVPLPTATWSRGTDLPIRAEVRAPTAVAGRRAPFTPGRLHGTVRGWGHLCHHLGDIRGFLNQNRFDSGKGHFLLTYFEHLDVLKPEVSPWTLHEMSPNTPSRIEAFLG